MEGSRGAGLDGRSAPGPTLDRSPTESPPESLGERVRDHRWAIGRIERQLGSQLSRFVDAEDVLQEVLCIAVHHRERVEALDAPQFRAWIHRVALRRILLIARGMRARIRPRRNTCLPPSHLTQMDEQALDKVPQRSSAQSAPGRKAPTNPVIAPLGVLRGECQRVLWLRDNFTLPWETVSFLLWRTRDASRQLHYRARQRLVQIPSIARGADGGPAPVSP